MYITVRVPALAYIQAFEMTCENLYNASSINSLHAYVQYDK